MKRIALGGSLLLVVALAMPPGYGAAADAPEDCGITTLQ